MKEEYSAPVLEVLGDLRDVTSGISILGIDFDGSYGSDGGGDVGST